MHCKVLVNTGQLLLCEETKDFTKTYNFWIQVPPLVQKKVQTHIANKLQEKKISPIYNKVFWWHMLQAVKSNFSKA